MNLSQIKTGAVIFCHNVPDFSISSIISSRIRKATDSFWNHVAIVGDGGEYVHEIHYSGIRKTPISQYLSQSDVIFGIVSPIGLNDKKRVALDLYLDNLYNKKAEIGYDTFAIFRIRWHLLFHGDTTRIKATDDTFLICSEFVQWALIKCGLGNSAFRYHVTYLSTPESLRRDLLGMNITSRILGDEYAKKIPGGVL